MINGLGSSAWVWIKLNSYMLTAGEHTLTLAYREDGAKLDKTSISNNPYVPEGMGDDADNCAPMSDRSG